jgi:transposase
MGKPGRPSPGLDDYLYWQERLANREASGLSIDEFCVDDGVSRTTFYRWVQRLKEGIPDAMKEEGASLTLAEIAEPNLPP